MTDNGRTLAAAVLGAVIGGTAGYLFLTARGRVLRRRIAPLIEDVVRDLASRRDVLTRASAVPGQGWRILHDAMHDPRYVETRQTSPF